MKGFKLTAVFLSVILLMTLTLGIVEAQGIEPKIPKPTPEFYSNDFADILETGTENDLVTMGKNTFRSTEGGQVVFVSVDSIGNSTIEEYANTLFNQWKIGTEDKGILFILSIEERVSRIEVGYGYEGVLTDLESYKLLEKFSQLNQEAGIDEAVRTIYSDICTIVNGDAESVQYPENIESDQGSDGSSFFKEHPILSIFLGILILILIILDFALTGGQITFFILRMAAASARRGGGGGGSSGGGGRSGGGGASGRF